MIWINIKSLQILWKVVMSYLGLLKMHRFIYKYNKIHQI